MIHHYLKIAFRNMWKYKGQTLVSVAGLAVGFVCFAMATLWIRYEMTYDSFHKNADRMYYINVPDVNSVHGISAITPNMLASHLKETFPEISRATTISSTSRDVPIVVDDVENPAGFISTDSSFLDLFEVKIIEGSMDFLIYGSKNIAVTREKSLQLFGNESPIGKTVTSPLLRGKYTICAVVTGISKHSNYTFDFLLNETRRGYTVIELLEGVDIDAFKKKLYDHVMKDDRGAVQQMSITPLTALHYEDPYVAKEVKFQHVIIFAVSGLLLVLCTLFNHLTLFISRLKIREREMALRRVYGASIQSLFALLSVEFGLVMLIAFLLGVFVIYLVFPFFQVLSKVKMELYSIYFEYFIYIAGIIFVSLSIFLMIFRHRTLNVAIHKSNNRLFRKISVGVQIIISVGFIFCTAVLLKQMYYLRNTDLGFAVENRGSIILGTNEVEIFYNQIKQIPEITESIIASTSLMPLQLRMWRDVSDWDDKSYSAENVRINELRISEQYVSFYELELTEGEMLKDDDDKKYVLINESAAKVFGWREPVGKSFDKYTVKGVIKNVYNIAPTVPVEPFYYVCSNDENGMILFKYREGTWQTCKEKIEQILKKEVPEISHSLLSLILSDTESEYGKLLKSEDTLLTILTFISLVCVVTGIFGFVSMIFLTCEERRKEIAVRKVNGATIKDILDIFFKEYFLLLLVGAVVALPAGYYIMKSWLEQYTRQTVISVWIYLLILLSFAFVIILCVGEKVYVTSRENPADVLKKE
jgi:hypothetical protein